jgi:hypothetical protein
MNWTYKKPFEQDLHDKYDAPAKEAVAKYMTGLGCEVMPNPDKYGVDLLVIRNGKEIGVVEVEVRQWSPNCPFPTIHVPERKTKFFNGNSLFFALTKDMQSAYWIESKDILKHPLKEVRNVKVTSGELFFDVPTTEFNFVTL